MSRIGRLPVPVPTGVDVSIDGPRVTVKGPKGQLEHTLAAPITIERDETGSTLTVARPDDERRSKALHGLSRTLVSNMVTGVTQGFTRELEIQGVGYRVVAQGQDLQFALGYSHSITVRPPAGVSFSVQTPTRFTVSGIDKQVVGEVAANIRKLRKPEPYKGKGVRYAGEVVRRKVGKAGK